MKVLRRIIFQVLYLRHSFTLIFYKSISASLDLSKANSSIITDPRTLNHHFMNNIGSIIEEQVRKQGRSISWLAKQLSCHRTNIYDIFKRNNIDILLLRRLSLLLNYDFFKDLSDDVKHKEEDNNIVQHPNKQKMSLRSVEEHNMRKP